MPYVETPWASKNCFAIHLLLFRNTSTDLFFFGGSFLAGGGTTFPSSVAVTDGLAFDPPFDIGSFTLFSRVFSVNGTPRIFTSPSSPEVGEESIELDTEVGEDDSICRFTTLTSAEDSESFRFAGMGLTGSGLTNASLLIFVGFTTA